MVDLYLLILVIVTALIFESTNAWHDNAVYCSTSIFTRVLSYRTAILMGAVFNCIGGLFGSAITNTIVKSFVDINLVSQYILFAALSGAILWNLITWWFALPSSSSHALLGALCGAVCGGVGFSAFRWSALIQKVALPLVISPIIGFSVAFLLMIFALWFFKRFKPATVLKISSKLQILSSTVMSYSHGNGDCQKTASLILMSLLIAMRKISLPIWLIPVDNKAPAIVIMVCAIVMGLGTFFGGKRIIKTLGEKVVKITPLQGSIAETSASLVLLTCARLGLPISTTHNITTSIMGSSAVKNIKSLKWGIAKNILVCWIITLPCSAALSYSIIKIIKLFNV